MSDPGHERAARYALAWMELRKRQRQRTAVLASIFAVPLLARLAPGLGILSFIAWIGLMIIARYRVKFWACPRCHKAFHHYGWMPHPFPRSCVHCQLPKGSIDPGGRGARWVASSERMGPGVDGPS